MKSWCRGNVSHYVIYVYMMHKDEFGVKTWVRMDECVVGLFESIENMLICIFNRSVWLDDGFDSFIARELSVVSVLNHSTFRQ